MQTHTANPSIMSFLKADDPDDRAKVTAESNDWKCASLQRFPIPRWFVCLQFVEMKIVGCIKLIT